MTARSEAQAAWDRVNGEASADHAASKGSGPSPRLQEEIETQELRQHQQQGQHEDEVDPEGMHDELAHEPGAADLSMGSAEGMEELESRLREAERQLSIPVFEHDPADFERQYEIINLRVIHRWGLDGN